MSMDEERLYGLMEIAERQQAAVQAALDGLAVERAALARERAIFAQEVRELARKTREAAAAAVVEGFADVGRGGVEAVRAATQPLISQLTDVTASAGQAEDALRKIISWARWRVLAWIAGLIVVLAVVGWLISHGLIWWDTGTVSQLQSDITDLQNKIVALQANHDAWVKAGMLDKIETCTPGDRPCVAVDESAGKYGPSEDIRVLKGY